MGSTQPTTYDEVPYTDQVFYYSHPDRLATMGRLLGMQPAPLERCRVLELGCGTGANLIRMATALPHSEFVGIDLSPRQIDMGRSIVERLGLANVDLQPRSILDVNDSFGRFDYLICHGVYSWVPAEVQDKILALSRQLLAPAGIAYISYNTYPGWHRRNMIREMMRFHVRQFIEPTERVQQARAMLDFLIECVGDAKGAFGAMLQAEADMLSSAADSYIYHEHLEENNAPVYFHEFAARVAAHGLQYLAEAQPTPLPSNLSPRARATLEQVSVDLIHGEQYLDFIRNRTFRRTLLVHDQVSLRRPPTAQAVAGLHVASSLKPLADRPNLGAEAREAFCSDEDARLQTNNPVLKAALVCLWEAWPQTIPFADLWEAARRRLAEQAPGEPMPADDEWPILADPLLQCFLSNLAELRVHPIQFTPTPSLRPRACPLARLLAEQGGRIANLRHRTVFLNDFERQVLCLLDGARTVADVVAVLVDAIQRGDLEIQREGAGALEAHQAGAVVEEGVRSTVTRLARLALLVE